MSKTRKDREKYKRKNEDRAWISGKIASGDYLKKKKPRTQREAEREYGG